MVSISDLNLWLAITVVMPVRHQGKLDITNQERLGRGMQGGGEKEWAVSTQRGALGQSTIMFMFLPFPKLTMALIVLPPPLACSPTAKLKIESK